MTAARRRVRDGTSKTWYMSGWHVFERLSDAKFYLKKFKHVACKAIVLCSARGLTPKKHSPSPVLLAKELLIHDVVWTMSSDKKKRNA